MRHPLPRGRSSGSRPARPVATRRRPDEAHRRTQRARASWLEVRAEHGIRGLPVAERVGVSRVERGASLDESGVRGSARFGGRIDAPVVARCRAERGAGDDDQRGQRPPNDALAHPSTVPPPSRGASVILSPDHEAPFAPEPRRGTFGASGIQSNELLVRRRSGSEHAVNCNREEEPECRLTGRLGRPRPTPA